MRALITLLFALLLACASQADDFAIFDSALAQVGMTHNDVRFDQDEMATFGGDLWHTTYYNMLHNSPFKLPKYGELTLTELTNNAPNTTALVRSAIRRIDHPIRRGLIGDQLAAWNTFPDSVPKPSITRAKNVLIGDQYAPLRERIDVIYRIVDDDRNFLKRGLGETDSDKNRKALFDLFTADDEDNVDDDIVYELVNKVDFDRIYAGAEDIAEAAQRLADSLETSPFPKSVVQIPTRKGLIVIGTAGNDTYDFIEPPLLIVDGGGDDVYKIKGYPQGSPVSIIVDLSGNDRYLSTDTTTPGIGGAILGVSVLIDKAGND